MNDELLFEMFVTWPAYQEIAGYVSSEDPRTADPHSVYGAACAVEPDRLAARLYGAHIGDSLEECEEILFEVMSGLREGHRPRFGKEMGLTAEMFRG
jgi:hypothetical protein